uniref:Uncharacterized protein n=1 Tax=Octopus bimaculoides TaxID=37653 RepID=A0A0L8G5A1_OCTBM
MCLCLAVNECGCVHSIMNVAMFGSEQSLNCTTVKTSKKNANIRFFYVFYFILLHISKQ